MVNTGHPSNGCETCKVRRVRCDENRPSCLKCIQSRRICLGYKTLSTVAQHPEVVARSAPLESSGSVSTLQYAENDDTRRTPEVMVPVLSSEGRTTSIDPRTYLHTSSCDAQVVSVKPCINRATICTSDVIDAGFASLQEPAQSFETRKELHQRYQVATHILRNSLSSSSQRGPLLRSIWLFALYEMTVSVRPDDNTWQTHLGGMLALLEQTGDDIGRPRSLLKAVQLLKHDIDIGEYLATADMTDFDKACIIMDLAKLQLRNQLIKIRELSPCLGDLRKIELVKLRKSIKQVYRNLEAVHGMLQKDVRVRESNSVASSNAENISVPTFDTGAADGFDLPTCSLPLPTRTPMTSMRWNEYRTLRIICASLLWRIGNHLHPTGKFEETPECIRLKAKISKAVDGIYSSIMLLLPMMIPNQTSTSHRIGTPSLEMVSVLLAIWSLYCASRAQGVSEIQYEYLTSMLQHVGEMAKIPLALSMAATRVEANPFSDTLAGLLIAGLDTWEMVEDARVS